MAEYCSTRYREYYSRTCFENVSLVTNEDSWGEWYKVCWWLEVAMKRQHSNNLNIYCIFFSKQITGSLFSLTLILAETCVNCECLVLKSCNQIHRSVKHFYRFFLQFYRLSIRKSWRGCSWQFLCWMARVLSTATSRKEHLKNERAFHLCFTDW